MEGSSNSSDHCSTCGSSSSSIVLSDVEDFRLAVILANAFDKCAWGESYWCSGLKEAKQCGAFQHCMTTIWANEKLSEVGLDYCYMTVEIC